VALFEIFEDRSQELAKIVTALAKNTRAYDYDSFCNSNTVPSDFSGDFLTPLRTPQ
jgi:hypothetical protein